MEKQITDTNPEIEKLLLDLIKKKTISQRLAQLQHLTSLTLRLSKRALARRYPEKTRRELDLLFIKYNYSDDLSEKVNQYLSKLSNNGK